MEFWPRKKVQPQEMSAEATPVDTDPEPEPEAPTAPEREIHGDFDHISSPEDFIKAVDFKTLNDIFDDLQRKSAGTGEIKNSGYKIDPRKISFTEGSIVDGENASELDGTATVSMGKIELTWKYGHSTILSREESIDLLRALSHEAAHIRGGYDEGKWSTSKDDGEFISSQYRHVTGLKAIQGKAIVPLNPHLEKVTVRGITGLNINEAVTENIANDVLHEYLIRTGNSSYLRDPAVAKIMGSYLGERIALAGVIAVLSDRVKIDPEQLWRALVQAYMSGNQPIISTLHNIQDALNNDRDIRELMTALVSDTYMDVDYSFDEILDLIVKPTDGTTLKDHLMNARIFKARVGLIDSVKLRSGVLANELGLRK